MERTIDKHENRKNCRNANVRGKIGLWRQAWTKCIQVVEDWNAADLRKFHFVFEQWIPLLNRIFESPIDKLERYRMSFYYCDEPNGPKELIHLYMDENETFEGVVPVYVIFNLYDFRKLHQTYCANFSKNNKLLVDEARGTINMAARQGMQGDSPASYFQNHVTWILLFISTLHALAHLEVFDKYDHAFYDNHSHVRDSIFYKLWFYGRIYWDT